MIGRYMYQSEKFGATIRSMMIPVTSKERAIADAMHEILLAFLHLKEVPEDVLDYKRRLDSLMGGDGSWEDQAGRLSRDERAQLAIGASGTERAI